MEEVPDVKYSKLLGIGAVVMFVAAATTINAPPVIWDPSWSFRLAMGGAGVLLALGALMAARSARNV
jgi:hypothetical protein